MISTNMHVRDVGSTPDQCRAMAEVLACIGDKWTVMIVGVLSHGPRRYNQIFREIAGISQRMLTMTLKNLERDGLVTRTVVATNPPGVDYALTKRGCTLVDPLYTLWVWAQTNRDGIEASRLAHDKKRLSKSPRR